MPKVIYEMGGVSANGYIVGPDGKFDWSMPDEELHRFHNEQTRALASHLLGRRLYETMVYWETADKDPSDIVREFALTGRRFVRLRLRGRARAAPRALRPGGGPTASPPRSCRIAWEAKSRLLASRRLELVAQAVAHHLA